MIVNTKLDTFKSNFKILLDNRLDFESRHCLIKNVLK